MEFTRQVRAWWAGFATWRTRSRFGRNLWQVTRANVLAQALLLLAAPLLTRLYAPESFGSLALFTSLLGLGLAHGLYLQLLDLTLVAIALHTGQARIHHITNARYRDRCLGEVGGEHHAAALRRPKDAVLVCLGQARKEGQDLDTLSATMTRDGA